MKKLFHYLFMTSLFLIFITTFENLAIGHKSSEDIVLIKNASDIVKLFPKTVEDIELQFQLAKENAETQIQQILSTASADRTFENTVLAFDKAAACFDMYSSLISIVKLVYPNDILRNKAEDMLKNYIDIEVDLFQANKKIYEAFKEYQLVTKEVLNEERDYYFKNVMEGFKTAGFELPDETFIKIKELNKKISTLSFQFHANISEDNAKICFELDELKGLNDDFIKNLTKTDAGYVLPCDFNTSFNVMSNCSLESTRQQLSQAYRNRAYPKNIDVLNQLINLRDELAHLLGFKSYAELTISPTMAETIERVESFLGNLSTEASNSIKESYQILMNNLPEGVNLTPEGQLKPWDFLYLLNYYLKKELNIDQNQIAEYFPMEATIRGLLDIYEQFFNLKFEIVNESDFWDPSVQLVEVRDGETDRIIGYVLMDLIVRENKYTNPCCVPIVPSMSFDKGKTFSPAVAAVNANFPKSTKDKPSLLNHIEVKTFFHEFGHAIHALSGKAEMPTKSGLNTKFDFVEAPSQLLEEWIWDKDILKRLSHHYQTGKSLPDHIIESLIKTRTIKENTNLDIQLFYAKLSLNFYKEGQNKDLVQIKKNIDDSGPRIIACDDKINGLCSFVHLSSYGPKYYTYLWSEQLAKKIFNYIKLNGGLLDPVMGKRYISKIIGRGGSCSPNQLMDDFLGTDNK